MSDWFRVEVSDHGGQIVAIEPEMLAGRDIGDRERELIEKAIASLSGFIGGLHTCDCAVWKRPPMPCDCVKAG